MTRGEERKASLAPKVAQTGMERNMCWLGRVCGAVGRLLQECHVTVLKCRKKRSFVFFCDGKGL